MNRFIAPTFPTEHPGVARLEAAAGGACGRHSVRLAGACGGAVRDQRRVFR